jgi:hypothetical protein
MTRLKHTSGLVAHALPRIAMVFVAVATVATSSSAQSPARHPDFSGTWILDAARSDSSSFTPKSATWVVVQRGDSLVLDRESPGTGKQHAVYALDGTPRTNTLRLVGTSTAATSLVSWHGDSLMVHTTSRPQDADLVQTDTWMLNAAGTGLRIKREAAYAGQSMGSPTLVFVKQ